jgi:hypothetical protein
MSREVEKFFTACKKDKYVSFFTDNRIRTERFVSSDGYSISTGCLYTDAKGDISFLSKLYVIQDIKCVRYFWLQLGISVLRPEHTDRLICTGFSISYFNRKLTGDEKFDVHFEIPSQNKSLILSYGSVIDSNLILLD